MTATTGDKGGKLTSVTLLRAREVVHWLVGGHSRAEIQELSATAWGLSKRQTDRLIAAARQEIIDSWEIERPQLTSLLLTRADQVFKAAMAQNNYNAAIAAVAQTARLAKLG